MDAKLFTQMLSDKHVTDLKKLGYKYPQADIPEFVGLLQNGFYKPLKLRDFAGNGLVFLESAARVHTAAAKVLLTPQQSTQTYGLKAMEEEIASTLTIENIDYTRDSVRRILSGHAPKDESENRILGMKIGFDFISNPCNEISVSNIYTLYQTAIGAYVEEDDRLQPGQLYRNDDVFVMGSKVEHTGLPWKKLPEYMAELAAFINEDSEIDDLTKAAIIHFYIAYLHPYFDGNGRMARLMHLWFLVRKGYPSALFIPLSEYVGKSKAKYYDAFTLAEDNARISGVMDVAPFVVYFTEEVYRKLGQSLPDAHTVEAYQAVLERGGVTERERDLWAFVLTAYGSGEFSTKMLEKDFGNAAYATIRTFVMKFAELGLLSSAKYGSRTKYRANV